MVVEGRMMNEKRRDRITELDVRLFDFEDESEKEGELQHEETDTKVEKEEEKEGNDGTEDDGDDV